MDIKSGNSDLRFGYTPAVAINPKNDTKKTDHARVLKNNIVTRTNRSFQQITSAFTEYPAKGLKGDKSSTFYEFLTMGIVPYLLGSATFMGIFNLAPKFFPNFDKAGARAMGNKMALGVIFYGVAKSLSKKLITAPVKLATGIDTEMPYENVSYSIPDNKEKPPTPRYEQHKVFESCDFPRFDLLYNNVDPSKPRNEYYDYIAKKNGLGDNLEASDAEVKPLIKDVISRSNTAKSLSSYLWAANGVMLATQPSWTNFFKAASKNSWVKYAANADKGTLANVSGKLINCGKNIGRIAKSFGRNFINSAKEFYHGPATETGFRKHAGKVFIGAAVLASAIGAINTIYGAKTSGDRKLVINSNKNVTVD